MEKNNLIGSIALIRNSLFNFSFIPPIIAPVYPEKRFNMNVDASLRATESGRFRRSRLQN